MPKKCPWNVNGCCKRYYMHTTSAVKGGNNAICYGRQQDGMTYRDCEHYINPNEGISENAKKCKFCDRREVPGGYKAYCMSDKYPGADGVNPQYVDDKTRMAICMGSQRNNMRYTSCKYCKGGKKIASMSGTRRGGRYSNSAVSNGGKDVFFEIVMAVVFFLMASSAAKSGMEHSGIVALILFALSALNVVIMIKKVFKKK